MHKISFDIPIYNRHAIPGAALAAVWLAGLALGMTAIRFYGAPPDDLIVSAAEGTVSFSALVVVTLFPLLLSACAAFLFKAPGVYALCLMRGVCLGLMIGWVTAARGPGGILLGALLLFSALAYSPVLLWYWHQRLTAPSGRILPQTLGCACIGIGISALDCLLIAPFLADVMTL